jgi:hypothetical protein
LPDIIFAIVIFAISIIAIRCHYYFTLTPLDDAIFIIIDCFSVDCQLSIVFLRFDEDVYGATARERRDTIT